MKTIPAFFGWKYVKTLHDGKYHYYNCPKLIGVYNKKTCSSHKMDEDLARHPYTTNICNCLKVNNKMQRAFS